MILELWIFSENLCKNPLLKVALDERHQIINHSARLKYSFLVHTRTAKRVRNIFIHGSKTLSKTVLIEPVFQFLLLRYERATNCFIIDVHYALQQWHIITKSVICLSWGFLV